MSLTLISVNRCFYVNSIYTNHNTIDIIIEVYGGVKDFKKTFNLTYITDI